MEALIKKFYESFANRDWQTMQTCYHNNATFSDPIFHHLSAVETKAMWHMLTTSAKELTITFYNIEVNGLSGSCQWEATYPFSKTGRRVHNKISSTFTFQDGKILTHHDSFDLWRWARMAFGFSGWLFGWTPFFQGKIQATANKSLQKFLANTTPTR